MPRPPEWRRRWGIANLQVVDIQVDAGGNDWFIWATSFLSNNDSNATGRDGTPSFYDMGMLFDPVLIPGGATIQLAHVVFEVQNTNTPGDLVCDIGGHDTDDAVAPTTRAEFLTDLSETTSAEVAWDNETFTADTTINTPDITAIIQEIVDRDGWASGQAMQIHVDERAGGTPATEFYDFDSYDNAAEDAPILHVEFVA